MPGVISELAKRESSVRAKAAFRDAVFAVTEDDMGRRVYVVSWANFTRELRDLSDVERLIETLPRVGRYG